MNPVVRNGAPDTANADLPAGLAELLGDDFLRDLRVQEAIAKDLADHLVRPAGGRLGASLDAAKGRRSALSESRAQLRISLLAESVLPGRRGSAQAEAFPFDEHQQLADDFVSRGDRQSALRANQFRALRIELQHKSSFHEPWIIRTVRGFSVYG